MKAIEVIVKGLAYIIVTLLIIGMASKFGEYYGNGALVLSVIFWIFYFYRKPREKLQVFKESVIATGVVSKNNNDEPSVLNTSSQPNDTYHQIPLQTILNVEKKSPWVTFMAVVNILLLAVVSKYFLVILVALIAMTVGGSAYAKYMFVYLPIVWLSYFVTSIIAIYRSFTKKSPILSVKNSNYFVFWPLIHLIIIALLFASTFIPLFF